MGGSLWTHLGDRAAGVVARDKGSKARPLLRASPFQPVAKKIVANVAKQTGGTLRG